MTADDDQLSAIKIFGNIQDRIREINTYPLCENSLVVNRDAYRELAMGLADGMVFARLGVFFPTTFHDLMFQVDFADNGVAFAIGPEEAAFLHYEHLGDSEEEVVERVMGVLAGLANGQLGVLITMTDTDEVTQVVEAIYRRQLDGSVTVLATYPSFDGEHELGDLRTHLLANSADIPTVRIHLPTYKMFLTGADDTANSYNRQKFRNLRTPLTHDTWQQSVRQYYDDKAEKIEKKVGRSLGVDETLSFRESLVKGWREEVEYRHVSLLSMTIVGTLVMYAPLFTLVQLAGLTTLAVLAISVAWWQRVRIIARARLLFVVGAYIGVGMLYGSFFAYSEQHLVGWIVVGAVGLELLETVIFDSTALIRRVRGRLWRDKS